MMMKKVVVFGKHYVPALGVVRSLGEAGYRVELIYVVNKKGESKIAGSSKYLTRTEEIENLSDEYVLNELLDIYKGEAKDIIVLFPIDDYATAFVGRYRERLEPFIFPITSGDKSIVDLMDKSMQNIIAKDSSFKSVRECVVDLREEINIPEEIVYPCFCKPLLSIQGNKQEMTKCLNQNDLLSALKRMKDNYSDRRVLIQEFLEIEEEYDVSGMSMNGEVYLTAVVKKLQVASFNRGPTELGTFLDIDILKDTQESIVRFIKKLEYNGVFDIELFKCADGIYFNELNVRPTGIIYAVTSAGCNLPAMYVSAAFHDHYTTQSEVREKDLIFLSEKVAVEDYIHGQISLKKLKEMDKRAQIKLLRNKNDPKPGVIYSRRVIKPMIKRGIKNLLGK